MYTPRVYHHPPVPRVESVGGRANDMNDMHESLDDARREVAVNVSVGRSVGRFLVRSVGPSSIDRPSWTVR